MQMVSMSRRRFLKLSGWTAAGVTVLVALNSARSLAPALPTLNAPTPEDSFSWVQMLPDGKVRFFYPRMEMGQGATLGLSQVVAEELNIAQSEIECVLADTSQIPPFKMTVGSESIKSFYSHVSFGSAHLREQLRLAAAETSEKPVSKIADSRGGFLLPEGKTLTYQELRINSPSFHSVSTSSQGDGEIQQYALKRKSNSFLSIGQSWPDHSLESIVSGEAVYSRDVEVPGMMYGKVAKPPSFGARLLSVNAEAVKSTPGFVKLVFDKSENFAGVIAENPLSLDRSFAALSIEWSKPKLHSPDNLMDKLDVEILRSADNFEHLIEGKGNLTQGRRGSQEQISSTYHTPFAAHAAIEPRAAVCRVQNDVVEVWCGTQDPFFVQKRIAKKLGREADKVIVYPHRMGGGFGGRVICQASEEAAVLSEAISAPVKVQWDRDEEFRNNYFQPAFAHFIEAGASKDGDVRYWDHDFVSSPIITGPVSFEDSTISTIAALAIDTFSSDEGALRGGRSAYGINNKRLRYSDIRTEAPIGAWRGLGSAPNNFAIESMIDELAAATKMDPMKFRLKNLPARAGRLINVIKTAEEISHWHKTLSANKGRGIACGVYKNMTYVATVAEVFIDHEQEKLRIDKVFCVHDCGLIVNPDQVKQMIAGNIIWGCGMALKEKISIKDSMVEQDNFDSYEILRQSETPDMSISLVQSNEPPAGAGEAAFMTVAPAITNAIFSATKKRVRSLPVSYEGLFS